MIRFFLSIFLFTLFSTFNLAKHLSIENEFVKIIVNNEEAKGRFSLETTGGSPNSDSDDYQDLIYGKPSPWTSYTTFLINNQPYIFGNKDTKLSRRTKKEFDYLAIDEQIISQNKIISKSLSPKFSFGLFKTFFITSPSGTEICLLIDKPIDDNR